MSRTTALITDDPTGKYVTGTRNFRLSYWDSARKTVARKEVWPPSSPARPSPSTGVSIYHIPTQPRPSIPSIYTNASGLSSTYDHTYWKARDPVRSPLVKPVRAGLVVGSVTTSEYPVLYVFCLKTIVYLFFWEGRLSSPRSGTEYGVVLGSDSMALGVPKRGLASHRAGKQPTKTTILLVGRRCASRVRGPSEDRRTGMLCPTER